MALAVICSLCALTALCAAGVHAAAESSPVAALALALGGCILTFDIGVLVGEMISA
jgi:hypothetical protein